MKYIIGLGNPGKEYELSRHNIGFLIVDYIAQKVKASFMREGKSLLAKKRAYALVKPQTYMNLSGLAVKQLQAEPAEDLIIVVDDIYLPLGEVRIREKGGDGGHNGLLSVMTEMNTEDFTRIRIGVGSPENSVLRDYVLSDFSEPELKGLEKTFEFTYQLINQYIHRGYKDMLNYYSKNKKSYSESISDFQNLKTEGGK